MTRPPLLQSYSKVSEYFWQVQPSKLQHCWPKYVHIPTAGIYWYCQHVWYANTVLEAVQSASAFFFSGLSPVNNMPRATPTHPASLLMF